MDFIATLTPVAPPDLSRFFRMALVCAYAATTARFAPASKGSAGAASPSHAFPSRPAATRPSNPLLVCLACLPFLSFSPPPLPAPTPLPSTAAAMAAGNTMALLRPRGDVRDGELERPPLGRSLIMIGVGAIAAIWAMVSLIAG